MDTNSWFIEHTLINICTQLDNFELAKKFSLLTENSLKCFEQWENLSRYYTDEAQRLFSSNKLIASKDIYYRGLNLAKQIKFDQGILSNSNGLVAIFLRYKQLDSAKFYLSKSEIKLSLIKNEKKYLEYKSDFEDKKSQYYELINDNKNCLTWTKKSIESLKTFNKDNPNIRGIAKSYRRYGSMFLKYNQLDSAEKYFNLGLKCLIPNLEDYSKPIDRKLLYQENAFIELFDLKTNLLQIRYERSHTINYIEEALMYNEHILWLNNNTIQNILGDETKLLNIAESKSYVGIGLDLLYLLNSLQKINTNDSVFRNYFNYSKAQLVNTKLKNKQIVDQIDQMDQKTKVTLSMLQDSINLWELISERSNEQNLYLIQAKIELENIIKTAEQTTLKKIYPKNYIEYSVQRDYIYRLARLNNKIYFDRIGETVKFDSLFKAFIDTLVNISPTQHVPIYKQISDFLLQGIDSILPYEFTIIPDANISFIPFDCLKDPFNKNLIDKHLISYSHTYGNSISKDHSNSKEIFTLAPQYPPSINLPSIERGSFYELKHSLEECQQIQNYYPDAKSLSRHITKNNLLDTLTNAAIFHFAGHGKVSNDSSYLLLANNQEYLRYEDISNYYNNMDLVVLSACETGLGAWNPGDGSKSLAKAFIESGTGAVVYSLWKMNDISTQKIMGLFYQYLSMGQAKDEALRNAKLSYIYESDGDNKQNFYWAGFVATGDMAPILQKNPILHYFQNHWVIGVTICFLLIIGIIYRFNKS
ncbi:MAG: CHAT domain-containing protein [Saprospiraceae bacterium]|uniref:CHAT domain-containing protein n=1 Tax=Candidatus Defluviibacterium haderslevense TaxID=2981993 RepID=A0A9D7XD47_9BACT|nr:CHAT domain-containing protein [Candidatus Defluviibacterium haderslevense]